MGETCLNCRGRRSRRRAAQPRSAAKHGDPTQTRALLPGSVAIDAGPQTGCPAFDQRGFMRPIGLACDIGTFEYGFDVFLPLILR